MKLKIGSNMILCLPLDDNTLVITALSYAKYKIIVIILVSYNYFVLIP